MYINLNLWHGESLQGLLSEIVIRSQFPVKNSRRRTNLCSLWWPAGDSAERERGQEICETNERNGNRVARYFPNSASLLDVNLSMFTFARCVLRIALLFLAISVERRGKKLLDCLQSLARFTRLLLKQLGRSWLVGLSDNFYVFRMCIRVYWRFNKILRENLRRNLFCEYRF